MGSGGGGWGVVGRRIGSQSRWFLEQSKMSPASYFFLFEKGEKDNKWNLFTVVVKKHLGKLSVPLLVPDVLSRTRTVVDIRFAISCDCMQSHAIACDLMRSHAIACDRMRWSHAIEWDRCDIAHKRLSLTKNLIQRPIDASFWHLSPGRNLSSPGPTDDKPPHNELFQ